MKIELENFRTLDLENAVERAKYEHRFYEVFSGFENQAVARHIWVMNDDEKRIGYRLPDEDIAVYIFSKEDDIDGAVGINTSDDMIQLKLLQFEDPFKNQPDRRSIEVLSLFANKGVVTPELWREVCLELKKHGVTDVLATCSEAVIKLHRWLGFNVLDQKHYDELDDMRYFTHFDLSTL